VGIIAIMVITILVTLTVKKRARADYGGVANGLSSNANGGYGFTINFGTVSFFFSFFLLGYGTALLRSLLLLLITDRIHIELYTYRSHYYWAYCNTLVDGVAYAPIAPHCPLYDFRYRALFGVYQVSRATLETKKYRLLVFV
jgi:hypothetical protein